MLYNARFHRKSKQHLVTWCERWEIQCARHRLSRHQRMFGVMMNTSVLCKFVALLSSMLNYGVGVLREGKILLDCATLCLSTTVRTTEHGDKDNVAST